MIRMWTSFVLFLVHHNYLDWSSNGLPIDAVTVR